MARKPKKKPWGLEKLGSLRVKIKLTVTVRPGSKVKYNEGKYKLTNYIDWVDKYGTCNNKYKNNIRHVKKDNYLLQDL